jgi:hypothetical protein
VSSSRQSPDQEKEKENEKQLSPTGSNAGATAFHWWDRGKGKDIDRFRKRSSAFASNHS